MMDDDGMQQDDKSRSKIGIMAHTSGYLCIKKPSPRAVARLDGGHEYVKAEHKDEAEGPVRRRVHIRYVRRHHFLPIFDDARTKIGLYSLI